MYVPHLESGLRVARLLAVGVILPVSAGRVDGRAQLGRGMEDLMIVLDSELVDGSEGLRKMPFLGGSEIKVVDHVGELRVGHRSIVDESAVGYE